MSRLSLALLAVLHVVLFASCSAPAVGCKASSECTDSVKPVCAVSLGACVECNDSSQCKDGFYCDGNGSCSPGCSGAHDRCTLGLYCKPGTGCVQCTSDSQCSAGELCTKNACVPGCSKSNPTCADGKVCDTSSGTCVGCVDGASCGDGKVCDPTSKTCVQCTADSSCSGSTPACDTTTHTCVGCIPSRDTCAKGSYCRPDEVCERGCKTGADCPSGTCLPTHSCDSCTSDTQCAAGNVCTNGTCTPACSDSNPCGSGRECCAGHCSDKSTDPNNCGGCGTVCTGGASCCNGSCGTLDTADNCGACGNKCDPGGGCCGSSCIALNTPKDCGACGHTCTTNQFCDGTTCRDVTFPEFCRNLNVYAIHDDVHTADGGVTLDNAATEVLASTIKANCSAQTVIQVGSQNNPAWVDQDAGTLLLGGGSTVVTAGGPFPNKVTKWLERTDKVTKVYFSSNGSDTFYFKLRADDSTLVTRAQSWCTAHQDVFVVELAADPTSSTLALLAYGLCSPGNGTATAAWYWANVMLPGRASYPDSWYLYEWIDSNNDGVANVGDTFNKLASGK